MIIWLIPSLFALCYTLMGGIEFGLPLYLDAGPDQLRTKQITRWFTPAWEVTNVFLVMALTSFMVVFPLAIPLLSNNLRNWILISGILLILRAALVLAIFYGQVKAAWSRQALVVVSLLIPATLAQVVLALILPDAGMVAGLAAAIGAIGLVLALSAAFFTWFTPEPRLRNRWLLGLATLSLALAALSRYDNLALVCFATLVAISASLLASWIIRSRRLPLIATVISVIVLYKGLLLRQWPDVVYNRVGYAAVATGPANQRIILFGFGVGIILIVPALFGLSRVLKRSALE